MTENNKIHIDPVLNRIVRVEYVLMDLLEHLSQLLRRLKTAEYYYEIGDEATLETKVNSLCVTQSELSEIKEDADKGIKALQDAIDHLCKSKEAPDDSGRTA